MRTAWPGVKRQSLNEQFENLNMTIEVVDLCLLMFIHVDLCLLLFIHVDLCLLMFIHVDLC